MSSEGKAVATNLSADLLHGDVVITPSHMNELVQIVLFLLTLALALYTAAVYPATVQIINLGTVLGWNLSIGIPLFGILPLIVLVVIIHNLFNFKYVLCDDYVLKISGIVSPSSRTTRVQYLNIKTVEIRKNLIQRLTGVGDVVVAAEMTQTDSEIVMHGVANPHHYKDIIHARIKAKQAEHRR